MDAVGSILAEKEKDNFPWGAGIALALGLHLAIAGAFLASSMAKPMTLSPPRTVAVRILSAGALRSSAPRAVAAAAAPARPKIEKPPEEAPPPPSEKAVLLPAREEKKKKPTPAAPVRSTAPAGPDVSLPSSGQSGETPGAESAGMGGKSAVGVGPTFDQAYFRNSDYPARIGVLIGLNWVPPPSRGTVNPVIRFKILRDGTVTDVQVVRSSGLPFLDRAALRAVIASSPLPPLPADYPGADAGAAFEFE